MGRIVEVCVYIYRERGISCTSFLHSFFLSFVSLSCTLHTTHCTNTAPFSKLLLSFYLSSSLFHYTQRSYLASSLPLTLPPISYHIKYISPPFFPPRPLLNQSINCLDSLSNQLTRSAVPRASKNPQPPEATTLTFTFYPILSYTIYYHI